MTYEPHHAYDDHCDYIGAANAAEMEEMGFDKEAAEWYAYEDNNKTEIDDLKSYFFDEDVFQKSEAMRLRDGDGKHSWAALHSVLKHGTDQEIVDYMRGILDIVDREAKRLRYAQELFALQNDFRQQVAALKKSLDETEAELLASIARDKQNRKNEVQS